MTGPDSEALNGASPIRSLGFRSDFEVMRGAGAVEVHPDRIILRTPSQPEFWWGNMVLFRSAEVDPVAQPAKFRADFPTARHVAIGWDAPEMRAGPGHAQLEAMGYEVEQMDVLTLTGRQVSFEPPDGLVIRAIGSDADWDDVVALQTEVGLSEGYTRDQYEAYLRGRFAARRQLVEAGRARWFGAFDGAQLVGDLGMHVSAGTARFQDVETRASHRRRGICAALVTAALDWALRRDPAAVPVIVALSDGPAGRIYRRCGFAMTERQVVATLPAPGAKGAATAE